MQVEDKSVRPGAIGSWTLAGHEIHRYRGFNFAYHLNFGEPISARSRNCCDQRMLTASEFGVSIQTSPFKQRTFKFGLIDASRTSTTYLQHAYRFLLFVLESDSGNGFHDDQHLTRPVHREYGRLTHVRCSHRRDYINACVRPPLVALCLVDHDQLRDMALAHSRPAFLGRICNQPVRYPVVSGWCLRLVDNPRQSAVEYVQLLQCASRQRQTLLQASQCLPCEVGLYERGYTPPQGALAASWRRWARGCQRLTDPPSPYEANAGQSISTGERAERHTLELRRLSAVQLWRGQSLSPDFPQHRRSFLAPVPLAHLERHLRRGPTDTRRSS